MSCSASPQNDFLIRYLGMGGTCYALNEDEHSYRNEYNIANWATEFAL